MSEPDSPPDGTHPADPSSTPSGRDIPAAPSRRRFLQTLTIGGTLALAGCGQDTSTTPTSTQVVSGQTFRAPTGNNPAKTAFYRGGHILRKTAYAGIVKENASGSLQRFLRQPGVWIDGGLHPTPNTRIHYNWIEKPIEISPNEVTIKIRDDARWSDGHPITGKDIAFIPIAKTLRRYFSPPPYATDEPTESESAYFAFDDFEIHEQSVTYRSSPGYFANFWDTAIAGRLGTYFGGPLPTHIEPFGAYADAVIETARQAQAGEINPWKGIRGPNRESLVREHLAHQKYVEKFSKPKNVLATGPWKLVELRGSEEFIFEKNPKHRQADTINFETFIFEYISSSQRQNAALKADRLDYGSSIYGSPTPQTVVDSLSTSFNYLRVPGAGGTGTELEINFDNPALEKREIRMAIMYALDHTAIAKNIHQSVAVPITTPGGDCWDATDYVDQEWIDENLTTYSTDKDKAADLMRAAGYTMDGANWSGADGKPLTLTMATANDAPRWEPTVASQLSEFGIQTTVNTLDGSTFRARVDKGEVPIWHSINNTLTNNAANTLLIWNAAAKGHERYGIYPDEQFETGEFSDSGTPLPRTEERWIAFTIKAPPIGEPNGPLQEYHPSALGLSFYTNPPKEEFRRRVKVGMWLANWFLPTFPLTKRYEQHFIDDAHWLWPTNTPSWKSFVKGDIRQPGEVLGSVAIRANPDNPEEGAK